MATMRVVQVSHPDGPFEIVERPIPEPGATQTHEPAPRRAHHDHDPARRHATQVDGNRGSLIAVTRPVVKPRDQ